MRTLIKEIKMSTQQFKECLMYYTFLATSVEDAKKVVFKLKQSTYEVCTMRRIQCTFDTINNLYTAKNITL